MNKIFYLAFSGLIMLAAGILLYLSDGLLGIENAKIIIPALFIASGVSAIIFSGYDKLPKIAKKYHIAQGAGLIVFAVCMATIPESLKSFLMVVSYFVLMYGLFEIIFTFGVLGSNHKINKRIMMSRIVAGVLNLIGGFVLVLTSLKDEATGLTIASILIIIAGASIAIFAFRLRKMESPESI